MDSWSTFQHRRWFVISNGGTGKDRPDGATVVPDGAS